MGCEPLDLNRRIEPTVISKKAMFSTWKAYFLRPLCTFAASARTITGSAETYLARIKTLAKEHGARCVAIDPVSKPLISRSAFVIPPDPFGVKLPM